MQIYFAPMEGITGVIYRSAHAGVFGGVDAYYAPFIFSNPHGRISKANMAELSRDAHPEIPLIPQILSNNGPAFAATALSLKAMGFEEVNLNLGCPSQTVAGKGRGAGFLACPDELERFLDYIFDHSSLPISIKTRVGMADEDQWGRILEIYSQYPVRLLIVHPRLRTDFYQGTIRHNCYEMAREICRNIPLCYNGDIFNLRDHEQIINRYPDTDRIMIGRGLLSNPALGRRIRGGEAAVGEELERMLELIGEGYMKVMKDQNKWPFLMKEQWRYFRWIFSEEDREKTEMLLRERDPDRFARMSQEILRSCRIDDSRGFVRF